MTVRGTSKRSGSAPESGIFRFHFADELFPGPCDGCDRAAPERARSADALAPAFALVLEERDDGIRPVPDVVERLLVADPLEADDEDVQLPQAEPVARLGTGADAGVACVGFGLTDAREAQH